MLIKKKIRALLRLRYGQFRNFLFSNRFKEFLFFLFFVFIACVFWLLNALNYDLEDNVTVNVQVGNVPDDVMFITNTSQPVNVRIRDKGTKMVNYIFRVRDLNVNLDFSEISSNEGKKSVIASDFLASRGVFPLTASIISTNPDTLFFEYTTSKAVKLPVKLNSEVKPDLYHYAKSVELDPDSVTVYMPIMHSAAYDSIETVAIPQQEISETSTYNVRLKEIPGAKIVPSNVKVTYNLDVYVDKALPVSIVGKNFPPNTELKSFPAKVDVAFQIGSDDLKVLDANDFVVVIDYNMLDLESEKAEVKLDFAPKYVRNARLLQTQVDYLLER